MAKPDITEIPFYFLRREKMFCAESLLLKFVLIDKLNRLSVFLI